MLSIKEAQNLVNHYISEHEEHVLPKQKDGYRYYRSNNTKIMERKNHKAWISSRSLLADNPYRANNKIASSFMKILVDQKIGYSVNDKMAIKSEVPLEDYIDIPVFRRKLFKACKNASNKFYGVAQCYIDKDNQFAYKLIDPEQVIRIYSRDDEDSLDAVIRYYYLLDEEGDPVGHAELYDSDDKWVFTKPKNGDKYVLDVSVEINPSKHMKAYIRAGESMTETEGTSWGRPPFVFLNNNDDFQRDLDPVKPLIDVWDIVMSDFANNLEDFQDVYWILKNYDGQDIDEFFEELERYKAIKVGDDGEASAEQVDIPTEARAKMEEILSKMIFKFGRGVNEDLIDGNVTNVRIFSLYAGLDLKANEFEMEIQSMFRQLLEMFNIFQAKYGRPQLDVKKISIEFNRATIMNKSEIITTLLSQTGFLSKKTLLELHPDISDVEEELKRLAEENQNMVDLFGGGVDAE